MRNYDEHQLANALNWPGLIEAIENELTARRTAAAAARLAASHNK